MIVLSVCRRAGSVNLQNTNQFIKLLPLKQIRSYADKPRFRTAEMRTRSPTLKERLYAPASGTAISVGQGALAGGSLLGIGALCYYGLGLSKQAGAIDRSMLWSQLVKDRISTTYTYFGSALAITAASTAMTLRSPTLLRLVAGSGWMSLIGTFVVVIGSGILTQSIEYTPGFGAKQISWALHSGLMGAVIAPICLMGSPVIIRALWYTAGIVGGLSTIAICAPSDQFLKMGAPLGMGLGVVFMSSIAGMFLSPATAIGSGLYAISTYGGLLLFSGFILYDTQRIIKYAESYPTYGVSKPFDPINASLSIYMDTLNIFIRLVMILSGGGNRRK